MSTVKTKVNKARVIAFLEKNFDKDISNFEFIKGGESSQAFSFKSKGSNYVIRVLKQNKICFTKDKFAYDNFSSYDIPIPKIHKIGNFDGYQYAISDRVPGKTHEKLNENQVRQLIPNIIKVLDNIHSVNVAGRQGFGDWNKAGVGKYNNLEAAILDYFVREENKWAKVYKDTCFERFLFDKVRKRVEKLVKYVNHGKYLVHADFGFSNMLSDGLEITGVIDWEQSMYGDFLYDVAWLEFWSLNIGYAKIFKDHYKKTNININNWNERMLCYILWLSIGSIGFFAESGQEESYKWTRGRMLSYLES